MSWWPGHTVPWRMWYQFRTWIRLITVAMCLLGFPHTAEGAKEEKVIPRFLPRPVNVTVARGEMAVLLCAIEDLATKTVIWRKQPYKVPILVGTTQFLELHRYQLHRVPRLDEWNLLIKNAQPFDSGTYECQVSLKGHFIRRNISLTVVDVPKTPSQPEITITGTQFVEKGGSIHIVCNASGTEDPPQTIDWFKDGVRLESKFQRNLYIQEKVSLSSRTIISALDIHKARRSDTGVYICRATDKLAARINVDVLIAETYNEKRDTQSEGQAQNANIARASSSSAARDGPPSLLLVTLMCIFTYLTKITQRCTCARAFNSSTCT